MTKTRKKKRHTGWIVLGVLVIIGAGLFLGRNVIVDGIKEKAVKAVSQKLIESQLGSEITVGGQTVNVSDVIDNMDEADIQKVNDIAEKYISPENVQESLNMIQNGNISELKDYAKESLTQEDKQELQGIYEKYKDQIPNQ